MTEDKKTKLLDYPYTTDRKDPINNVGSIKWMRGTIEMEMSISEECAKMTSLEMMDHLYNLAMFNRKSNFRDDPVFHHTFIKNNILRIQYIMNKLMNTYLNDYFVCYYNADKEKVISQKDATMLEERIHANMYYYMLYMIPGCPDYRKFSTIDDYRCNDRVYIFIRDEIAKLDNNKKENNNE